MVYPGVQQPIYVSKSGQIDSDARKIDSYLNITLPQLIRCHNNVVNTIPSPSREFTELLDVLVGFLKL